MELYELTVHELLEKLDNNEITLEFSGLDDKNLLTYVEDTVYQETIECLNSDQYVVEEVKAVYDKYYANETFVRVLDKNVCPQTKWVEGSNYVDVNFVIDKRTNRVIMMGAIDNLVKGAAGQAVQNMNLMFGLPENEGLALVPMFP